MSGQEHRYDEVTGRRITPRTPRIVATEPPYVPERRLWVRIGYGIGLAAFIVMGVAGDAAFLTWAWFQVKG